MIRDILKKATKGAITWVGTKFGIPAPITKGATDIAESLFTKQVGGSEFQIIDTSVQKPRFGGRLGFNAARMAGTARGYAETVNPETLRASWDSRLAEYYTKTYRVKRTTTLKA